MMTKDTAQQQRIFSLYTVLLQGFFLSIDRYKTSSLLIVREKTRPCVLDFTTVSYNLCLYKQLFALIYLCLCTNTSL